MMGNEWKVGMGGSSLNLPHTTWHLVIVSSSQPPRQGKQSSSWQKDGTTSSLFQPIVTSLVCHLLVWPIQFIVYTRKLGSGFRGPEIPLHFSWTQMEQPPCNMEFVPTPLRHTAQGSLQDFWSTSSPGLDIRTLVLPMLTWSPFPSMLAFQRISLSCSSSSDSLMMSRLSACRFS